MFERTKRQVAEAFRMIAVRDVAMADFICVSGICEEQGRKYIVITPPHPSSNLSVNELLVADLNGRLIEGSACPQDIYAHIELYKAFNGIGGIVHTHSDYATSFAQAGRSIKPYGVTHARFFKGTIPCTTKLSPSEISDNYEKHVGLSIIEAFEKLDQTQIQAALVYSHGVYCWGDLPVTAANKANALERIARIAYNTEILQVSVGQNGGIPMQSDLLNQTFGK